MRGRDVVSGAVGAGEGDAERVLDCSKYCVALQRSFGSVILPAPERYERRCDEPLGEGSLGAATRGCASVIGGTVGG